MTYKTFEGEKTVRTVKLKKDDEFFDNAKGKLGFKEKIDFITFCAAIALRKEYEDKTLDKIPLTSGKRLAGMATFEKRHFYDYIILEYLDCKEGRLKEFETYFYTGFNILKKWFEEFGPDANSEIERFSNIWDYITEE